MMSEQQSTTEDDSLEGSRTSEDSNAPTAVEVTEIAPVTPDSDSQDPSSSVIPIAIFIGLLLSIGLLLTTVAVIHHNRMNREQARKEIAEKRVTEGDFISAILNEDQAIVDKFLKARQALSSADGSGITPVTAAIIVGNSALLADLINNGANFVEPLASFDAPLDHEMTTTLDPLLQKHCFRTSSTPLHIASAIGNSEAIELLLSRGANPNTRSRSGWTPLLCSAVRGKDGLTKLILAGADPDAPSPEGTTALMLSALRDNTEAIRNLGSADFRTKDNRGWTALHHFASRRSGNADTARELLTGAEPTVDNQGNTPLMIAAQSGNLTAILAFLEKRELLTQSNQDGETAWQIAERSGHPDLVPLLNAEYRLFAAIKANNPYLVKLALAHGANPNISDREGITPLIFALSGGKPQAIRALFSIEHRRKYVAQPGQNPVLIQHGTLSKQAKLAGSIAQFLERVKDQDLHLHKSLEALSDNTGYLQLLPQIPQLPGAGISTPVIEQIITPQQKRNLFVESLRQNEASILRLLLEEGADVNHRDDNGNTALLYAVQSDDQLRIKLLIEHNADPFLLNDSSLSPVALAVKLNRPETAAAMLRSSAVKPPGRTLELLLLLACERAQHPVVELILKRGTNPNLRDDAGRPLLFAALTSGDYTMAQLLGDYGARISFKDKQVATLYSYAKSSGQSRLREFIDRYGIDKPGEPT